MADIKLLDCTLRDGGYVNNWQWGFGSARRIIQTRTRAGVDVVEVGFLRNVDGYDPDVTVCNTIEELNRLLPDEGQRGHTMYSGMAMRSNYDIAKLSPYDGRGIEIIRKYFFVPSFGHKMPGGEIAPDMEQKDAETPEAKAGDMAE